jgi:hypothetical protein
MEMALIGTCTHKDRIKTVGSSDPMNHCWHVQCKVIRTFHNGRYLLENPRGFVIAADPSEVVIKDDCANG